MKISLKILESEKEIGRRIANAMLPEARKYFNKAINIVKKELPTVVSSAIINSEEYRSILGGKLRYEFGIPNPSSKLAGLIDIWSKNINIEYISPNISGNGQIRGKFSASMIKVDFSDVLFTDFAEVYDQVRGYKLPWLEWLVLRGNATIVKDYEVVLGPNKSSRTGYAIMSSYSGSTWKVPGEFAGTIGDNWITRSIDRIEPDIQKLLEKALSI